MEDPRPRRGGIDFPFTVPAHPAGEAPPAADAVPPGQLRRFVSVPGYSDGVHENVAAGWLPISGGGGVWVPLSHTEPAAATSHSVNNVFTADYITYVIVGELANTGVNDLLIRLRVAGTDSIANYDWTVFHATSAAASAAAGGAAGNAGTIINSGVANDVISFTLYIARPFLATPTAMHGTHARHQATAGVVGLEGFGHRPSTSYDGFTLLTVSGTFTGSVDVYGIAEAA